MRERDDRAAFMQDPAAAPRRRAAPPHSEPARDQECTLRRDGAGAAVGGRLSGRRGGHRNGAAARRRRYFLCRRRHQGLHGAVQDAAARARREGPDRAAEPALRRVPRALRPAAADDRHRHRRRGLRRRARPRRNRRRRPRHGRCALRHVRDRPRHRPGADRALRRGAGRRAAGAAPGAHRRALRRARGVAHRPRPSPLRGQRGARIGAAARARRYRPLRARRQRGDEAPAADEPHHAARRAARPGRRRLRRGAARGGGKGRRHRLHREAAGVLGRQARDAALSGFGKILVANRGEIACRVMRTARALGYRTVAVYSEADRDMPHVALADQAVPIGPAPAADSYLATDKIIAAARRAGADAIHPGYGFLSENAAFAAACAVADITFIGPPVEAIRTMGNKAAAKRRMIAAGVPCVPGHEGAEQSDKALAKAAAAIGLPVMVKAAAGGGGKGMRLVAEPALLAEALRAARSEAQKAFGSDELILEKAIVEPRHVEIQIFADSHGHVIHLGERDCSIQRRHQKVIEEGPSPVMTPALRQAMGAAAVTAAKTVDYVGAGTVEFLLAPDGSFSFLEMNTRLQVEHAVTEMVTGVDLVEWQIRVASGEALPLRQDDVAFTGHAIEARLYAEDAQGDFLPQAGRVLAWKPPSRAGVRVDHGIAAGVTVSPYYDPMLAKIIAHGATREAARRRLVAALMETVVLGVVTNRRFLIDCLSHSAFAAGDISTGFIARHFPPAVRAGAAPHPRLMALAAALIVACARGPSGGALSHWRSSGPAAVPLRLRCGDTETAIEVTSEGDGHFRVTWGGESCVVALFAQDGTRLRFLADGLAEAAHIAWDGDALHLSRDGATALAPMPGTVAALRVKPGDAVRKGQCLLVLEAMKMEHEITAPRDGTVAAVLVSPGEQVATRKLLVELAPQG